MRALVGLLASACLLTAIACSTGDTGQGGGGATGGGAGGGGTGGGSAGGGAGGGSTGGGSGGGSAGGGSGGGSAGGGSGGGSAGGGSGGGAADAGNPRLLGITWNGNMQMDAGQFELRRVDPQTGSSTLVAAIPGVEGFYSAAQATDGRGLLYVVSYSFTGGPRLFTIDANTGAVLRSPGLDRPAAGDYNWSGGLHLRPDAGLVGVTWNGPSDAGSEELRTINPVTGNTALVAALPGMDWLLGGANASDPSRDVAYAIASANADPRYRLFSLRLTSGQVLASPVVDGGPSGLLPFMLFPRSNGTLRTLVSTWAGDAGSAVADLNPTTGALSQVSTLASSGFFYGIQAFDAVGERAYFVDDQSRLITLNVATGAVVSSPTLAPNDAGVSFYFGGGLYFVR